MLSPDRIPDLTPLDDAAADYDVVRRAIGHIRKHWREQPEIEAIAEAASVTPTELHHLFRRWAGLTPKAFVQALTLDGARQLLRDSASVLDATYEVGLSGPGRLHDLFVTHEAMSPGEWKSGGEGLTVRFGFHPSPFGKALVMATERGLAGLAFADPGEEETTLADMQRRWPKASYVADPARTAPIARRIFDPDAVARRPAASRGAHRHRLGGAGLGDAIENPDGQGRDLFRHRRQSLHAERRPRRRRRGRQEPGRRSWCRATASSAKEAASPATTGASPANRPCSVGRREGSAPRRNPIPASLRRSSGYAAKSFFSATVESALSR